MGDEMLASVCELAFDVAKEGNAPSAMKNYLYLAQRPPRAYSVAQRALEEDTAFRARVADRATIENVGEAGYLWLRRPDGWEQRLSGLNVGDEPIDDPSAGGTPLAERPPMPTPPTGGPTPATQIPTQPAAGAPTSPPRPAGPSSTVSSIESELSSLRGLVDRLADERQNVRSSVTELEVELETRRAENIEMFTKLSALRSELTTVQSSETSILEDRDRALARVAELEADVARLTAEVDRLAAEATGSSSEHDAALTDLATVSAERDALKGEVDAVTTDRNSLSTQIADSLAERDRVQSKLDATNTALGELRSQLVTAEGERSETLAERDRIQSQLNASNIELEELRSQLTNAERERNEMAERLTGMEQLRSDNVDLATQLSVAEQARIDLEGQLEDVSEKWKVATRQLSVFENVNSQLDTVVAERDVLQDQLSRTNEALGDLQGRIGTSHEQIRNELTTIESTFGEVRSLPQADVSPAAPGAPVEVAPDVDFVGGGAPEVSSDPVPPTPDFADSDLAIGDLATDPAVSEPEISVPEISTPEMDLPPLDGVDAIDVPSISEGVEFTSDVPDSAQQAVEEDDFFDGEGIEMDRTTLGGRTIGEMFRAREDGVEPELPVVDAGETLNGNTSPDADGLDALMQAAADEPVVEQPLVDVPPVIDPIPAPRVIPAAAVVGPSRRQLSIPAGLDDASFARMVVESPDVVLLIDGDGTAGLGWPHLDVATRRGALVDYLGSLTAATGAAADVVFARPVGGEDALPVSRAVRVRIADAAVAESPIFSAIVDGYPEEWPIAIVTNEPTLLAQAGSLEVTTLSNDQLLDLFLDLNSED